MESLSRNFGSLSTDANLETLEKAFNAWTLADLTPISQQLSPSTFDSQALPIPPSQTKPDVDIARQSSQKLPNPRPRARPGLVISDSPDAAGTGSTLLERLWLLDEQLDSHMKSILLDLDALDSPEESKQTEVFTRLVEERGWLRDSLCAVDRVQASDDAGGKMLKNAMVERLLSFAMSLDDYIDILQERSSPDIPTRERFAKEFNGNPYPICYTA